MNKDNNSESKCMIQFKKKLRPKFIKNLYIQTVCHSYFQDQFACLKKMQKKNVNLAPFRIKLMI